ncbi:MAG: hypothetical protein O3B73_16495 [bacterium]|nr:hypothetical protein [bacterium]
MSEAALGHLSAYDWPGNVRDLKNIAERLAVNSHTNIIGIQDLPHKFQNITPNFETSKNADISSFLGIPLAEVEKMLIDRTLIETSRNRAKAARMLGISLRTLQRKIKETGREEISPLNAKTEV